MSITKKQIVAFKAKVEAACKRLRDDRDALKGLMEEYDSIVDDADEAADAMDEAVDALSRLL